MRIVIDLQCLQTSSRFRGIGHYVSSLLKALLEINAQRALPQEIVLLFNSYDLEVVAELRQRWASLVGVGAFKVMQLPSDTAETACPNMGIVQASEAVRNDFIERLEPDFVLVASLFEGMSEDFVCDVPRSRCYQTGVIGYDLIPLISPEKYLGDPLINDWYHRKLKSFERTDAVFAISESAHQEFETHLEMLDGKVLTISTACDDAYYPIPDAGNKHRRELRELGIDGPFVLYSGAPDERKNLNALLQAFSQLMPELRKELRLVLVGRFGELDRAGLTRFAKHHGIPPEHLIYTGFVSQETLNILYNTCVVFVFPSRHEGFGLPVLEAMTCGAPVICSNTTSLPEVMGLEAAMFGPDDLGRITRLIERVVTEAEFREQLSRHGLRQSGKFCWKRTAETLLSKIEQMHAQTLPNRRSVPEDRIKTIAGICKTWQLEDKRLRQIASCLAGNDLSRENKLPQKTYDWRIEGPFDSSYSLALLNREIARGLCAIGQRVSLHSTEGPGDFDPSPEFLVANPDIAALHARSKDANLPSNIVSRNLYPPRVEDMPVDKHRFLHLYAWEESGFPAAWVNSFNENLTGITCLSEHVMKTLIDNGVCLHMAVSGCGVDHWDRVTPEPWDIEGKAFRFLHVSSCFPRKGIDALLESWGKAFSRFDDVTLIIKTFENPHNTVVQRLAEYAQANPDYPDVVLISEDLPPSKLKHLYEQCHALVAPSKAEGFGLPLAEAMLSGLPVIATDWSGQLDFCNHHTAWLTRFRFEPADTHFKIPDSVWASPDIGHLASQLKEVHDLPPEVRCHKAAGAAEFLRENFTWEHVALRLANQAETLIEKRRQEDIQRPLRVAWVSTWNQRCGLATYSKHLVEQNDHDTIRVFAPDIGADIGADEDADVERCWQLDDKDTLTQLSERLLAFAPDAVVIQMNYYFFDYDALERLIATLKAHGTVVTLTLHSTADPEPRKALSNLRPGAEMADRIIVHTPKDLTRLAELGLAGNATIIPHGLTNITPAVTSWPHQGKRCIASYGFALPHKGLEQLVDAFAKLQKEQPGLVLLLLNAEHQDPVSGEFIKTLHQQIHGLGLEHSVHTEHRFLPDEQSIGLLQNADIIAMPYQNTGESSSGAVKMAIGAGRPVLVTPLPIFEDVAPAVDLFEGTSSGAIYQGLKRALASETATDCQAKKQWHDARTYPVIARRTFAMLRSLWINR